MHRNRKMQARRGAVETGSVAAAGHGCAGVRASTHQAAASMADEASRATWAFTDVAA